MQLISTQLNINFMGRRKPAMLLSAVLIVISIASLAIRQLDLGIDFTGGHLIEVGFGQAADLPVVRRALADNGYGDAQVQYFGTSKDVLIRLEPRDMGKDERARLGDGVVEVIRTISADVELRRNEFVGPNVGEELREEGGLAMLIALGAILLYVALRFELRFALGSVAALAHDVILVLGFFSLFQFEFDLPVLAAVLAVIGYSLNDTIVVFDRIRENFRRMRKGTPEEVMNTSLNQTLARTLMTSLTTMLVLLALFFLGGEVIHNFALALIVGVIIGTYSSIYVASSTALALGVSKQDLMPVQKDEEAEQRP